MSQCASCSAEIGKGGIHQQDGTALCVACDKIANGRQAKNEVDARNITFCPKCSAVWNRDQSYCAMCHWDVVTGKHVQVKVPKKYVRVSVDVAGVILAVIAVVGGYIGYDYYRSSKAKANAEAVRLQDLRLENERKAEEERQRVEQSRIEKAKLEMQKAEARKAEADALKAKVADARAKREATEKLAQEDEARRHELELAAERKRLAEEEAEARRLEGEEKRKSAATREQKIALLRQDLKVAESDIRTALLAKEKLQPLVIGFKNRMDASQKLCADISNAMALLLKDARTGTVQSVNGTLVRTPVRVREDFTLALRYLKHLPQFAPENNFEEQALKLKTKYIAAQKDYDAAARQLNDTNAKLTDASVAIENAQRRGDDARAALKDFNVDAGLPPADGNNPPAAADSPPPAAGKGKAVKIYKMKDGTVVRAVSTVVSGDDITVKDENGKFKTISRKDIESEDQAQ